MFIRESLPPIVLNIAITKHERWGDCGGWGIYLPCLKRLWAEIEVEALDVSEFSVTVTISEDDLRSVTFVGKGHEWFMVALDLKAVEVLVRYEVSIAMEDFAGNELDPPYEKEMDGLFGGVLRMLEDLWDWLVDVATAIVDAVAKAVSFIVDMIVKVFELTIQPVIDAVLGAMGNWFSEIFEVVDKAFQEMRDLGGVSPSTVGDFHNAIEGTIFVVVMAMAIAASVGLLIALPYLIPFSFLIGVLSAILITVLVLALGFSSNQGQENFKLPDLVGWVSYPRAVGAARSFEDENHGGQDQHALQWAAIESLMLFQSAKWSAIAAYVAGDVSGTVAAIGSIVTGVFGLGAGIAAKLSESYVLGALSCVFAVLSVAFGAFGIAKSLNRPDVSILSSVGVAFSLIGAALSFTAM